MWPCKWWIWKALSIIWTGPVLCRPLTYTVSIIFLKTANEGEFRSSCLSYTLTQTVITVQVVLYLKMIVICLFVVLNFQANITTFHPQSKELLLLISNLNLTLASISVPQQGTGFEELLMFQWEIFWTASFRTCDFYFKLFFPCFYTTLSILIYSFPPGNTFALNTRSYVYLVPAAYCFHWDLCDLTIKRKITDILGIKSRRN